MMARGASRAGFMPALLLAAGLSLLVCARLASAQSYADFHRWCFGPVLDKIIAGCDRVIAENRVAPRHRAMAFNNRGYGYYVQGERDRAMRDYDAALAIEPDYVDALINRGRLWHDQGDFERALQEFETVVRIDPRSGMALYNRGNIHLAMGKFDTAIRDYDRAIGLDPKMALAYTNRCWARSAEGPLETALRDCDHALQLEPRSLYALNGRGVTWLKLGDVDGGEEDIDTATRAHKDVAAAFRRYWVKDL